MTYQEALTYLHDLQRFGMKPGLERTAELLRRAGRPDQWVGKVVHITGTSGKGSVAVLVESALRAAGGRVGLYTSPSLRRFTERIQINRVEIAEDDLADVVTEVAPHVASMVAEGWEQPTEFEVTTVAALLYFSRQQLDWLVLEVGLGGRFDATTVVEHPSVTCITNIGLDHTDWLGSTHEQIAWDKAGIIKTGVPCVTGTEHPGALQVIRGVAVEQDAALIEVGGDDYQVQRFGPGGQVVSLLGARGWYRDVDLALLGEHQAFNAAVAVRVLELAGVGEDAIRQGLRHVVWPGRFEVIPVPGGPTVLLDAAHNPAKCGALAEAVRAYFPGRPVLLVLGALADKDVEAMARPLLALAERVWTTTPESPRRLPAAELQAICVAAGSQAAAEPSIPAAVEQALQAASPAHLVLITGSFYTVGPARDSLLHRMGRE